MFSTALVIFRESLEIALILGIILAATRGLAGRMRWILGGFAVGALGAGLVALFAETISASASGLGQELFNALILFTAALVIGWTALWMRKHGREMTAHLRQVGQDVSTGKLPLTSLSMIIGLAILREGSEIVLFIYGMVLSGQSAASIVSGSAVGMLLGISVGALLYYGLLKLSAKYMLRITGWLLLLLVAGLAAQGAGFLSAAGYFEAYSRPLWDSSAFLSEGSILGKSLHSLIGYTAKPTAIQLIFYIGSLMTLLALSMLIDGSGKRKLPVAMAALVLGIIALPRPGMALDKIYSPYANKGEFAIEYIGSRSFDGDHSKNNAQSHEFELEYGLTDRWTVELVGEFEKEPGESTIFSASELENIVQFTERGEYWVDSGILLTYIKGMRREDPDAFEAKLLLEKDWGKFTHRANIGFEQELGRDATGGPEYSFIWNSRYRFNRYFEPGIELQSGLGRLSESASRKFDNQEHYVGPSLTGNITNNLKYEAAYLFGVSDAASDGAARVSLEYEMHF